VQGDCTRTFPDNVVFNKRLTVMKHPLETLTTAAGILLMAFISVLLLPPFPGAGTGAKTAGYLPFSGPESALYRVVLPVVSTTGCDRVLRGALYLAPLVFAGLRPGPDQALAPPSGMFFPLPQREKRHTGRCHPGQKTRLTLGHRAYASMRARMILFAPGARRLIERAGKDPRKGLLRIKAIFQANIVDLIIGIE
jgi:hypothetical protein